MSYGLRGKKIEEPKKMNLRWWFTDACHAIVLHYHKLRSKNSENHLCLHPKGTVGFWQRSKQFSSFSTPRFDLHGYSTLVQTVFCLRRNQNFFLFNMFAFECLEIQTWGP